MTWTSEVTTHLARKRHRCDWCWEFIEIGERYKRYRWAASGDVGTCKEHPECHAFMLAVAAEEGGWTEWTPGQERPRVAA